MVWKTVNVTDAAPTQRLSFAGRGSLFGDGTFGGGTLQIKPVAENIENGPKTVSTGFAYSIDGSTIKTADVPSGTYDITLAGAAGGNVNIFYNDQVELSSTR